MAGGPSHGTLALSGDGSFVYVHDGSETSTDSFAYRANDGQTSSNVATVTITVTPVNDPPEASGDTYDTNEGGTLIIASPGVLGNDTDPEGDPLTTVLVSDPSHGILTLDPDGSFVYVHDGGETTGDSFTYRASDGLATSDLATVAIAVASVNDPPVASGEAYEVVEGGTLSVNGVLENDTRRRGRPPHGCFGRRPLPRYPGP